MTALNLSEQNIYIRKAPINGKPLKSPYFIYEEIKDGGELVFHMGSKPNKKLGTG
jgi:putative alpha-1,2-mannosidase